MRRCFCPFMPTTESGVLMQVIGHSLSHWIPPVPAAGTENWKTAPGGTFALAHSRPPCASMIERQIDSPRPRPSGFVV